MYLGSAGHRVVLNVNKYFIDKLAFNMQVANSQLRVSFKSQKLTFHNTNNLILNPVFHMSKKF